MTWLIGPPPSAFSIQAGRDYAPGSRCLTIESEIVAIASLGRQSTNVSSGLPFSTI
jgi:hypothetical protein